MLPERPEHLQEFMDAPDVNPCELQANLAFIRWVNRRLGGTRAVLDYLALWSGSWTQDDQPIRILDVATGSGDIPQAILNWADQRHIKVKIIALDLHAGTLTIARSWCRQRPEIQFIRGNALQLPVDDGAVDYAISSMFFHHLPSDLALRVAAQMVRVSQRGVIINDLLRDRRALIAVGLLTLFASRTLRHDACVSVRKGWTLQQAADWAAALSAPWLRCRVHSFARFTLAGEKPQANVPGE